MRVGAQFYTLREQCKDLEGLRDTLARVREIGYEFVQLSATCPYEPEWMRKTLDELGLCCILTHTDPKRIAQEPVQVAKDHDVYNCPYIGIGMIPGALSGGWTDYQAFRDTYLPAARVLQENGHYLMYHNHDIELAFTGQQPGETFLERMARDFPADQMGFTLDTYWIQHGGGDPAEWIQRLTGRVPCVHFKDMFYSLEDRAPRMAPVGSGNLNFERFAAACESAGTEYILVEQDHCYGRHPLDCLKDSYQYLSGIGLR